MSGRKRAVHQSPDPCRSIPRLGSLTALGVIVGDLLSFSENVHVTLKSRASVMNANDIPFNIYSMMYALRILPAHGMSTNSPHDVFNATALSKILYCRPVWPVYCSAADHSLLHAFIHRANKKLAYCTDVDNTRKCFSVRMLFKDI